MIKSTVAGRYLRNLYFVLLIVLASLAGCVSLSQKDNILAVVDESPITEADLAYSLNVSHRREDLSSGNKLDLYGYIQKMIDDKLIADEAIRAGLDKLPGVKKDVDAFILRESIVRLHDEEILRKVSVTDEDVLNEYKQNYFYFGRIETESEADAQAVLDKLSAGADFGELAATYSAGPSGQDRGEAIARRDRLIPSIQEGLSGLRPGETSGVLKAGEKYYILKLFEKNETDELFNKNKKRIEHDLRKQRQREIEEKTLQIFREKTRITINEKIFSEINLENEEDALRRWADDPTPLAEVGSLVITVSEFVNAAFPKGMKSGKASLKKDELLNRFINLKVIDNEALSRHYEMNTDLQDAVQRYMNVQLRKAYINKIVSSAIVVNEEKLKDYYEKHKKEFSSPAAYKFQQMIVKNRKEAEDALKSLEHGADFLWLARTKLPPDFAEDTIYEGWVKKGNLPGALNEVIDSLKVGDVSPIFEKDGYYAILRLVAKTEAVTEDFEKVKEAVYKAYMEAQYKEKIEEFVSKLRETANITVYDSALRALEEKWK